jgi:hypothetical protein
MEYCHVDHVDPGLERHVAAIIRIRAYFLIGPSVGSAADPCHVYSIRRGPFDPQT